jgi:hypothetical protein
MHVCVLDAAGNVVYEHNLPCHFETLLKVITPFRDDTARARRWASWRRGWRGVSFTCSANRKRLTRSVFGAMPWPWCRRHTWAKTKSRPCRGV